MSVLQLAWRESRRRPLSLLLLAGLALLGSLLVALGDGLARQLSALLEARLRSGNETVSIDIHPRRPEQALTGISFERIVISDDDVLWLQDLPGVERSMVLHAVPVPATIFVRVPGLLDNNQYLALYGIEADDMPVDLQEEWRRADPSKAVPIVMNPDVITYYNLGMADRYGLPRLDREILLQREFGLLVGRDVFRALPGNFNARILVRGYNGIVNPWGIAMPKHCSDAFLKKLFPQGAPKEAAPVQVRLFLDSADRIDALQDLIAARGLTLAEPEPLAGTIAGIAGLGRRLVAVIALVLLITVTIACASLVAGLISERRRQIALYRLGGARLHHLLLIFGGGLCVSLISATLCGVAIAQLLLPRLLAPLVELLQLPPLADQAALGQHVWSLALLASASCGLLACIPPLLVLANKPLLQLVREG